MKRRLFRLCEGEKLNRNPNKPVVIVVPSGDRPYLWIGNNAKGDKMCFAILQDRRSLIALAHSILNVMEQPQ